MGGGTELFPNLGNHCEDEDCHQLDFLPFKCDGCNKWFCLEHQSYANHNCLKAEHKSRVVAVCEVCSASVEKKAGETDEEVLDRHARSGNCDAAKKTKPRCPVGRCKEVLTFSNATTCKQCRVQVCLKHRFPSEHACKATVSSFSSSSLAVHPLVARMERELRGCFVDVKENKGKKAAGKNPAVRAH